MKGSNDFWRRKGECEAGEDECSVYLDGAVFS